MLHRLQVTIDLHTPNANMADHSDGPESSSMEARPVSM